MSHRATRLKVTGEVAHRHEADDRLHGIGTAVIVRRSVARALVMACPDGCGETLTINLDGRAGAAWRMYTDRRGTSLFPSVWRDNGCRSHFIVWQSRIYWCDSRDDILDSDDKYIEKQVHSLLGSALVSYVEIADAMGEVPWAVLVACNHLVAKEEASAGVGPDSEKFKRV